MTSITEEAKGIIYVLRDFNSRVGKKGSMYMYGEDTINNNGESMLEFCVMHN